jgi:hypothetical protein
MKKDVTVTIEVPVYIVRDSNDMPVQTCAEDFTQNKVCRFFSSSHFGTIDICSATNTEVFRMNGNGWIEPAYNCICKYKM